MIQLCTFADSMLVDDLMTSLDIIFGALFVLGLFLIVVKKLNGSDGPPSPPPGSDTPPLNR